MFPSITKQNMRFRGPMESEKLNRFTASEVHDAYKLSTALTSIGTRITALKAAAQGTYLQASMDSAQSQIDQVKGAIS